MEPPPFSRSTRFVGICFAAGAIPFAARLIWEMTLLTWREGPQIIGFSLAHRAPQLLILGSLFACGSGVWCICVAAAAILRRRALISADWAVMGVASSVVALLIIPYSAWQWATVEVLGVPPLPSRASDLLCSGAGDGDRELVVSLLNRGLDVDGVDYRGRIALLTASEAGQSGMVALLLRHGAHVNIRGLGGLTALHCAARNGHVEVVKLLMAAGADPEIRAGSGGLTAADLAWGGNYPEIVKLLEPQGLR